MTSTEKTEMMKELCGLLERGEVVAQALGRLRKDAEAFGRLTDLANELLSAGMFNIYESVREDMQDAIDTAGGLAGVFALGARRCLTGRGRGGGGGAPVCACFRHEMIDGRTRFRRSRPGCREGRGTGEAEGGWRGEQRWQRRCRIGGGGRGRVGVPSPRHESTLSDMERPCLCFS
jgi:hypothetical protein